MYGAIYTKTLSDQTHSIQNSGWLISCTKQQTFTTQEMSEGNGS